MKIATLIAAALVGATGFAAAPASAAPAPAAVAPAPLPDLTQDRVVVRERTVVRRDYGYRRHPRRVCTVRFRRGERIRTCRTVYRRY